MDSRARSDRRPGSSRPRLTSPFGAKDERPRPLSEAAVEDIARIGVEAGIEFDDGSLVPITPKKRKLGA